MSTLHQIKKKEHNLGIMIWGELGRKNVKEYSKIMWAFFIGWRMLGNIYRILKKNTLQRMLRNCKAVIYSGDGFIDENNMMLLYDNVL